MGVSMKKTARIAVLLISYGLFICHQAQATDTVIYNIDGYSWTDGGLKSFSALRFDATGQVVAVYKNPKPVADSVLTRIDGHGATLIPGLIDAHGHVLSLGRARTRVDLVGTTTRAQALQRVAEFARDNPDVPWILGRGWNQELWQDKRFPQASELDALGLSRPVWLDRIDGHAAWANTPAMKLAGVNRKTPDPHGGRILRDNNGEATGTFIDEASSLISTVIPEPTVEQDRAALLAALTELASLGLTGVHDAGIDMRTARLYRELNEAKQLPIRVYAMLAEDIYRQFGKPLTDDGTGFLAIQSVKAYLDGALGSRGAAMIAPYSDKPDDNGLLFKKTRTFSRLVKQSDKKGFQLNVHAIGDQANRIALDGFERLGGHSPLRHRIEHAQVVSLDDIPRFAKLGIIASIQPTHATSDKNMAEDRVGADRIRGAYAWRRLLDTGARLAGGSDFPVEPPEPLYGLHAAVTRQDRDGQPRDGWYSDQGLSIDEALRIFTIDAAYAARQEKNLGSLEPGKRADFVLLDRNIFNISPQDIWQVAIRETWVNGVCVYSRDH